MNERQQRNKTKTLTAFELPTADLKDLQAVAVRQDRSVSSLLRSAVKQLLATELEQK
jgi:hypothetical protein